MKERFSSVDGAEGRERQLNRMAEQIDGAGLLTMINTGGTLSLTTSYQTLPAGGETIIDETKKMFDYEVSTHRLNIHKDGYYALKVAGAVEFAVNAEFEASLFVNGVEYSPDAHIQLQGRGNNKPVMIYLLVTVKVHAGDYLELKGRIDTAGDLTMLGNDSSVEKKVF